MESITQKAGYQLKRYIRPERLQLFVGRISVAPSGIALA
ncbi:hypothetical protein BN4901_1444 [Citrobacter europaeus]|uniref:Uncharacterized protein n=1 Tax=Citrobacter europaeus TaxID=1914243 RepID=A0ABY0JM09_9ENTR|nr:hypothetical protein BN4901_1444 [Citrobacter europaeus]